MKIRCAAIKDTKNDKIYIGSGHGTISFNLMADPSIDYNKDDFEDGFVTDNDIFVNRKVAYAIALKADQIIEGIKDNTLKSWMLKRK